MAQHLNLLQVTSVLVHLMATMRSLTVVLYKVTSLLVTHQQVLVLLNQVHNCSFQALLTVSFRHTALMQRLLFQHLAATQTQAKATTVYSALASILKTASASLLASSLVAVVTS